jgi:NADH-quinone oxidoreductase subunit N
MNPSLELPALLPALPEIVLAIGAMALLMFGVFSTHPRTIQMTNGFAVALLIVAAVIVRWLPPDAATTFGGSFVVDGFGRVMKLLSLLGSAVAIIMSSSWLAAEKQERFEFPILILLSTLGMMLLVSAADLIALYLGLELMSLSLYVLAAVQRDNVRAAEAGLKYFVLGALSSGMLLYGASLIYGMTGTVTFTGIAKAAGDGGIGLVFGIVFLLAGF